MPKRTVHYVHITDVQRFLKCRRAWEWSSPLRANLTPSDLYAPFFTGTLVHHGLEALDNGKAPATAVGEFVDTGGYREKLTLGSKALEAYDLAQGMLRHYRLWQHYDQGPLADKAFNTLAVEHEFMVPLWYNTRNLIMLKGKFDGIKMHRETGKYYLWEIKTTRSIKDRIKQTELDSQTDAYLMAANTVLDGMWKQGIIKADADAPPVCSGIIYTFMRKRVPETPGTLKNGQLSQNKSNQSAAWFTAHAQQHHKDWASSQIVDTYGDFINDLISANTVDPYFYRAIYQRTPKQLAITANQLSAIAREMINKNTPIYFNPSHECNYCIFRAPCVALQSGSSPLELLEGNYKQNSRYSAERGDEE